MNGLFNSFLSVLQLTSLLDTLHTLHPGQYVVAEKTIAIVGGGTAGLGALKTILNVQQQLGAKWRVVLFEQRCDLGGIWCVGRSYVYESE